MKNKWMLALLVLSLGCVFNTAEAGKRRDFRRADKNNNGHLGAREKMRVYKGDNQYHANKTANFKNNNTRAVDKKWEAKADRNQNGIVSKSEAKGAYKRKAISKKFNRKDRKRADTNGDGKITHDEFKTYYNVAPKFGQNTADVNMAWEKIADSNGDAIISADEAADYYEVTFPDGSANN